MDWNAWKRDCKDLTVRLLSGRHCSCVNCSAELFSDEFLCKRCEENLPFNIGFVCSKCGRAILENYPVCTECKADMPTFTAARSAFTYSGDIVRLIKKFKTGGRWLAEFFAKQMLPILLACFLDTDFLIPVPMTESARKKRGYNQSLLLARYLSEWSRLPVYDTVLTKTRETSAQKSLSAKERAENLKGSFHVHERTVCRGKNILLVDDVLTTGATASAAAEVLLSAGAKKVYVLTAASVPSVNHQKGQN